jgi:peptidylprolyl isomerase
MKHVLVLLIGLSAGIASSSAQTASTPAKAPSTAKAATAAKAPASASASSSAFKLPAGIPRGRGVIKTAFVLRYQDLKLGTGADAEPNKLYKVLYTGWLAADGHKFDSSDDHRQPVMGADGKPVLGDDGKPKLGDPQPLPFVQGFGRIIPGFDQGFDGMKVGGKRRLFIPWQLAYGARGRPGPDPAHPGIPPKADLIFDVELVDVSEMQMPPHPVANPVHPGMALPPGHAPMNGAPNGAPGASPAQPPTATPPSATPPAGSTPPMNPQTENKPQ